MPSSSAPSAVAGAGSSPGASSSPPDLLALLFGRRPTSAPPAPRVQRAGQGRRPSPGRRPAAAGWPRARPGLSSPRTRRSPGRRTARGHPHSAESNVASPGEETGDTPKRLRCGSPRWHVLSDLVSASDERPNELPRPAPANPPRLNILGGWCGRSCPAARVMANSGCLWPHHHSWALSSGKGDRPVVRRRVDAGLTRAAHHRSLGGCAIAWLPNDIPADARRNHACSQGPAARPHLDGG